MPKRRPLPFGKGRPFRGKARFVVPGKQVMERATERPWRPRGVELDYYRVLDFVLAEHEELQGQDPRLMAIYNLVRERAHAGLENILVMHLIMLALGETEHGDRGALEYLLGNLFKDRWQNVHKMKVTGDLSVEHVIRVFREDAPTLALAAGDGS